MEFLLPFTSFISHFFSVLLIGSKRSDSGVGDDMTSRGCVIEIDLFPPPLLVSRKE
jgi:hypothetical protein